MIIEIDCNSDTINLRDNDEKLLATTSVKYPNKFLHLFELILNGVDAKNVTLTKIDEDRRTTVGEW